MSAGDASAHPPISQTRTEGLRKTERKMVAKVQLLSQAITVALCLSIPMLGYAQEVANPTTTDKVATLETIVEQIKSLIESMGYADVKLSVAGNTITGSATKDGRQVTIVFDEKGMLRIE